MKLNKDTFIGAAAILIAIGLLVWFFSARVASSPTSGAVSTHTPATSTPATSASTTSARAAVASATVSTASAQHTSTPAQKQNPLAIDSHDSISSWQLNVTESTTTKEKLQTQIKTLTKDIGTGRYPDFSIYMQIAQDYGLLGNGKQSYSFYIRAAKNDPARGVPFSNIGTLMSRLGAYHTAQNAFAVSVNLQPNVESFWLSYLRFLSSYEANAPATASVFTAAKHATGSAPNVLILEANWRAQTGNITGAVADWKIVRKHVGDAQKTAIDTEIAKLEKQQS